MIGSIMWLTHLSSLYYIWKTNKNHKAKAEGNFTFMDQT